MTDEPAAGDYRVFSPDEAFSILGHETWIQILQKLGAAGEPLPFTEARDRMGLKQGGQFNDHLDTLVGHFVLMDLVLVYDMEAERSQMMRTIGLRYLTKLQNSVCEGEVTHGDLQQLKNEFSDCLNPRESLTWYELSSDTLLVRRVWGEDPPEDSRFL